MNARRTCSGIVAVLFAAASQARVHACPVCFGIEDGPTAAGIRAAVIVLVGVTAGVLAGFAWFIARFVRRVRAHSSTGSGS